MLSYTSVLLDLSVLSTNIINKTIQCIWYIYILVIELQMLSFDTRLGKYSLKVNMDNDKTNLYNPNRDVLNTCNLSHDLEYHS